ncbi:MAG: metallophosphoesterase [Bacteroidales bacterium]|nr:metallophosphoesterase [Bacteroidales bacterium]
MHKMIYLAFAIVLVAMVYVMRHIWCILPFGNIGKTVVVALGVLLIVSMILSVVVGMEKMPIPLAATIYEITTSWIFILLYLLMIFLLMDILRLAHVMPAHLLHNSLKGTLLVTGVICVIFIYGNIHYYHKHRTQISATTEKKLSRPYKILMLSDLHIGYHNQRGTLAKWVDMLNAENADLILIAGDIIDISPYPVNEQKMYEEFHRLNAPVYACLGNHEFISGVGEAKDFYRKAGINLLIDTCVPFGDDLLIAGRNDRSVSNRNTIGQILENQDTSKYIFLLDHQPYNLEQAEQAGVDFQFSGHTHDGQVFPINLITRALYEKSYGSHQRGKTQYYVSSGLGIWGGKFRIGSRSEYVILELKSHGIK